MKNWIVERLEQRAAAQERARLIDASAERVFGEFWQAVAVFVDEAQQSGMKVATNGTPLERVVILDKSGRNPQTLTVALAKDQKKIAIRGVNDIYGLAFDVCPDNVVCLKLDGAAVSYREAAQAILDRFLFPELS
jgi:hypothetical protein